MRYLIIQRGSVTWHITGRRRIGKVFEVPCKYSYQYKLEQQEVSEQLLDQSLNDAEPHT